MTIEDQNAERNLQLKRIADNLAILTGLQLAELKITVNSTPDIGKCRGNGNRKRWDNREYRRIRKRK